MITPAVHVSADGTVALVSLAGELDASNADQVAAAVTQALAGGPGLVVVDLASVEFLDSTVLGAFVRAQKAAGAAGASLQVAGAHGSPLKVLALTGLDVVLGATTPPGPVAQDLLDAHR